MQRNWWIGAAAVVLCLQPPTACRNRQARIPIAAKENAAVEQLRSLFRDETAYYARNNHYACTIAELATSPGLVDREMTTGRKNGYAYSVHCPPQIGLPAFQVWASPLEPGVSEVNFYCTDETGVVRRSDRLLDACKKAKPVE